MHLKSIVDDSHSLAVKHRNSRLDVRLHDMTTQSSIIGMVAHDRFVVALLNGLLKQQRVVDLWMVRIVPCLRCFPREGYYIRLHTSSAANCR